MPLIQSSIAHTSGIPLGGIGTGSVEIRPDGLFHEWQIFNMGAWSPRTPEGVRTEDLVHPEDLVFVLRAATLDGDVQVRYLALRESLHDLYTAGWARSVHAIQFEGTFPIARLYYVDDTLPVQVVAEAFSPFIPLDSRASGTPGFVVRFLIQNVSNAPVDVSIAGVLRNLVGIGQNARSARNTLSPITPPPGISPSLCAAARSAISPAAIARSIAPCSSGETALG